MDPPHQFRSGCVLEYVVHVAERNYEIPYSNPQEMRSHFRASILSSSTDEGLQFALPPTCTHSKTGNWQGSWWNSGRWESAIPSRCSFAEALKSCWNYEREACWMGRVRKRVTSIRYIFHWTNQLQPPSDMFYFN